VTFDEARAVLLPLLVEFREDFSNKYPSWKASVIDSSLGDGTTYQAHLLGLSCLARDDAVQPDLLDLTVMIADLASTPTITSADLVWGDGRIVAELLSGPVALNAVQLDRISRGLSTLVETMDRALSAAQRSER